MKKNIKNKWEYILWIVIMCILTMSFTILFYCQAIQYNGKYISDLTEHISLGVSGRGYSFLYFIIGKVESVTGNMFFIALFESLMVTTTWLVTGKIMQLLTLASGFGYIKSCIISLPLIFLTGIYIPGIYEFFYKQQLITQPYHNITYYGMRMFSVLTMLAFLKLFDGYLKKIDRLNWCLLILFLTLSTSVKPNFLLGFAFTLLIFLIIDFVQCRFSIKSLYSIVIMGITVFPSLFVLLGQARLLYGKSVEEGGSGIMIIWGSDFISSGIFNVILKLVCGLSFPCLVGIVNRKKINKYNRFIYVMYVVQLAVCILFCETGARRTHGNFAWGLYNAAYLLFLSCIAIFINSWNDERKNDMYKMIYRISGSILLAAHFISGVTYFIFLLLGEGYGI